MRKRKNEKQVDRRTQIVQAAIQCFARAGIAETRLKDVARQARVGPPLLLYYFPTLNALHHEVVLATIENLKAFTLEKLGQVGGDPHKALRTYVFLQFEWAKQNPDFLAIFVYFYHLAAIDPAFRELNTQLRRTARERVRVILYEGIERGAFPEPRSATVRELAITIHNLLTGGLIVAFTENEADPLRIAEQILSNSVALIRANSRKKGQGKAGSFAQKQR